jgi:hypothetical protein
MMFPIILLVQALAVLMAIAGPLPSSTEDAITTLSDVEQRDISEIDDQAFTKRIDIRAITDEILFSWTIDQFKQAVLRKTPPELVWDRLDGCTGVFDFGFTDSCNRHDFGFANYRKQNRLCPGPKRKLDDLLCKDMKNYCDRKYRGLRKTLQRWTCNKAAQTYCAGVRLHKPVWSKGC